MLSAWAPGANGGGVAHFLLPATPPTAGGERFLLLPGLALPTARALLFSLPCFSFREPFFLPGLLRQRLEPWQPCWGSCFSCVSCLFCGRCLAWLLKSWLNQDGFYLLLLVWRWDGAGDAHAGVEALQPAARPATGQAERPQRATAPGAAAASAPSWRADDDRRAASAEWAPSPRAPPASCAAFAAAASGATKPSRTASETQHSQCSMLGRHATNETMTILAPMASSTDQEASLPALSEEHATIFVYVLCV